MLTTLSLSSVRLSIFGEGMHSEISVVALQEKKQNLHILGIHAEAIELRPSEPGSSSWQFFSPHGSIPLILEMAAHRSNGAAWSSLSSLTLTNSCWLLILPQSCIVIAKLVLRVCSHSDMVQRLHLDQQVKCLSVSDGFMKLLHLVPSSGQAKRSWVAPFTRLYWFTDPRNR